jgi:hypothetical protein
MHVEVVVVVEGAVPGDAVEEVVHVEVVGVVESAGPVDAVEEVAPAVGGVRCRCRRPWGRSASSRD